MLYGLLFNSTVYPGGFYAFMSQEFLHLFNRHTGVKQISGAGTPEPVRVDIIHVSNAGNPVKDIFKPPGVSGGHEELCC